jgi:hypothetical protein
VTINAATAVTATFGLARPPVISGPPSVGAGDLFCGVQHRGKCRGLKVKAEFSSPGNAVWQFAAHNPTPGHSNPATKLIALGTVTRTITNAGRVTIVFKLRPGARTRRLHARVAKLRLRTIRVTLTFTTGSGHRQTETLKIKLKLSS